MTELNKLLPQGLDENSSNSEENNINPFIEIQNVPDNRSIQVQIPPLAQSTQNRPIESQNSAIKKPLLSKTVQDINRSMQVQYQNSKLNPLIQSQNSQENRTIQVQYQMKSHEKLDKSKSLLKNLSEFQPQACINQGKRIIILNVQVEKSTNPLIQAQNILNNRGIECKIELDNSTKKLIYENSTNRNKIHNMSEEELMFGQEIQGALAVLTPLTSK